MPTTHESTLTDAEKDEFVMTDNASFGSWDFDAIANEWDAELVEEWGVDVWQPTPVEEENNTDTTFNLPEELAGVDIDPEALPTIKGEDNVPMERILIVYKPEEEEKLAALLGLPSIDKVVYKFSEDLDN